MCVLRAHNTIYKYQPDGLTSSGASIFINHPKGHGLWQWEKAMFLNYSFYQKLMLWYSFYCDHAFHLTCNQIADYIHAPRLIVYVSAIIHRLLHIFKSN